MRKGIVVAALAVSALLVSACADEAVSTASLQSATVDESFGLKRDGGDDNNRKISMRDNCDPTDPAWTPTGGCALRKGTVSAAEFNAFLRSPLTIPVSAVLIGHPSWRNEPSYLVIDEGKRLRVSNDGGRVHTFTEVAAFGGGRVPPLNIALSPAPECPASVNVAPGERVELNVLALGIHRFECCIHPWMRAVVLVQAKEHEH
jgi:plastocyanin